MFAIFLSPILAVMIKMGALSWEDITWKFVWYYTFKLMNYKSVNTRPQKLAWLHQEQLLCFQTLLLPGSPALWTSTLLGLPLFLVSIHSEVPTLFATAHAVSHSFWTSCPTQPLFFWPSNFCLHFPMSLNPLLGLYSPLGLPSFFDFHSSLYLGRLKKHSHFSCWFL